MIRSIPNLTQFRNSFRISLYLHVEWTNGGKEENLSLFKGLFTWGGGPQLDEVTFGGSLPLSRKHDQIKMRD